MTAAQPALVQANVFSLQGYDTTIQYETTSIDGTPRLTYNHRGQTLSFRGEEIQGESAQLGRIVTVNLSKNSQTIGNVETLTLALPPTSVPADTRQVPVQTVAILSLRSPQVRIIGQSQNYMTLWLSGTASQVDF